MPPTLFLLHVHEIHIHINDPLDIMSVIKIFVFSC